MIPSEAPSGDLPMHAPGSPLEACLRLLRAAAPSTAAIYLRGESGTGKEVLAQFLHRESPRGPGPLVAVNCAALAPSLLEAELFGVIKGAYTGALADRPGRIRQAQGGTLFLDEIGDMPLEAQTRLLRVLQEKRVCPVGGDKEWPVDFRLVCATHRDLRKDAEKGRFRLDLFYRLHVVEVEVPALRDRPDDIPVLLRHFLGRWLDARDVDAALAQMPESLRSYPFPGNVRELRNMAERYAVLKALGQGWQGLRAEIPPAHAANTPETPPSMAFARPPKSPYPIPGVARKSLRSLPTSRVSDAQLLQALEQCGWHRAKTAECLGISRRSLQYRLARWNRGPEVLYI